MLLLYQIPTLWYALSHGKYMGLLINNVGKCSKSTHWGEPGEVVPMLFSKNGWFSSIRFPPYGWLHHKQNAQVFPSMSHSIGKGNKTHLLGRAQNVGTHTFPKDSSQALLQCKGNAYVFPSMSLALKKATKPILWEQPRKLVPILFPKYGCFYSIRFVSFGVLRHIENAWGSPSIPHNMGKCNKIHHTGRAWDIITHTFPEIWVVLLYQISIL